MQNEDPLGGARRIMVYGVTGSGKTVAADRISEATGIRWVAVDELMWEPGWVQVPVEEQRRRMERLCSEDSWIIDSAYGQWLDVPLARVELIVALDYPRWFSLQRLVRRTAGRLVDQRPICNGNTESLREIVSSDSIIAWHFRSFRNKRTRIAQWQALAGNGGPRVLRFTRSHNVERWIESLLGTAAPS